MNLRGRSINKKELLKLIRKAAIALIAVGFVFTLLRIGFGILEVNRDIRECKEAIAQKNSELNRLEQKKAYYESDEFLEDAVREGGYVSDDETVFIITD